MLSAAEISAMRAQETAALPSTMTIKKTAMSSDGIGGRSNTPVMIYNVACRITPRSGREEGIDDIDAIGDFIVTFPFNVVLEPLDQIIVGSSTYEILHVYDVHAWQMAGRAEARLFE